jgi:hypothetical protein
MTLSDRERSLRFTDPRRSHPGFEPSEPPPGDDGRGASSPAARAERVAKRISSVWPIFLVAQAIVAAAMWGATEVYGHKLDMVQSKLDTLQKSVEKFDLSLSSERVTREDYGQKIAALQRQVDMMPVDEFLAFKAAGRKGTQK